MKFKHFLFLAILFSYACGDDPEDSSGDCTTTTNSELAGTILERPFGLQTARALYDEDEDEFQIQMFADDDINITDVCGPLGTILIGSQITFFIDNKVEDSDRFIVTLYHAASMEIETTSASCCTVSSITETSIEGKLTLLNPDGSTMVTGAWTAEICD